MSEDDFTAESELFATSLSEKLDIPRIELPVSHVGAPVKRSPAQHFGSLEDFAGIRGLFGEMPITQGNSANNKGKKRKAAATAKQARKKNRKKK